MIDEPYRLARIETLTKQVVADKRKLSAFRKTGLPLWMRKPEAMLHHRLNCALRVAELDFLKNNRLTP